MGRLDPGDAPVPRQIAFLAERIRFLSRTRFWWDGETVRHDPARPRLIEPRRGDPTCVAELAERLYRDAYLRPDDGRGGYTFVPDALLRRSFVASLDAVNASRWSWSSGWRIGAREGDELRVIGPYGERRRVPAAAFEAGDAGEGRVRGVKGSDALQPGWYHALGEILHAAEAAPTVRLYWNLCAAGAAPLVATATRELNRAGIPFHLKVVDDPQLFRRADAAVLYAPVAAWGRLVGPLGRVRRAVAPYLKPRAPLFTKPLAPGLAVAEDPADRSAESFGMHRCRLLAEGLWDAFRTGARGATAAARSVIARFRQGGIPWPATHLNAGSQDRYGTGLRTAARAALPEAKA